MVTPAIGLKTHISSFHAILLGGSLATKHILRAAEFLREAIFEQYHEEVPYSCECRVEAFKESDNLIKVRREPCRGNERRTHELSSSQEGTGRDFDLKKSGFQTFD